MNCINFTLRDFWIFILHIFSLRKKIPILKKVRTDSSYLGRRTRKKEKNALFFINMNPFVNYSARRAVQKWTGWDRNTVRHSSLNEKWVEIRSEGTILFSCTFSRDIYEIFKLNFRKEDKKFLRQIKTTKGKTVQTF